MSQSTLHPTVHASSVLVGAGAVLIRGEPGAGKSRLALELILAGQSGRLPFVRLIADDRTRLQVAHGRLLAHAPEAIAGLLEVRGLGLRQVPHEAMGVVSLVVDLVPAAERLPLAGQRLAEIEGLVLPRLAVAAGQDALLAVAALLGTGEAVSGGRA